MPQVLTLEQIPGSPGQVYYPLRIHDIPKPSPGPGELLIKLHAAALNHRDLFIRQHLYPGISLTSPLLADGCGVAVEAGPDCTTGTSLLRKRVVLTPSRGWASATDGPEDLSRFAVIGSNKTYPSLGTAADYVVVSESEVEPCPSHLSAVQAAALPLVGLTGWRALVTKSGGNAQPGHNILVTGIGGGVALSVLQFGVAMRCNMYVTSSSADKLQKAKHLGAKGGVSYKDDNWAKELQRLLPPERPYLDAVIDGAGGDVVASTVRLLKPGGVISCYGMTQGPRMDWLMQAVMKNVELRGTTMGSREEFRDMVRFVGEKGIVPVVSRTVKGLDDLEGIDSLFEDMRDGKQFGKLVIEISTPQEGETGSKL